MKILRSLFTALLLGILFTNPSFAQQKRNYSQEADQAFEDKMFNLAIEKYEKAYSKVKSNKVEKNRLLFQISECYRLINDWKKAEGQYKRLEKISYFKTNPLSLLYYGDALKINGKYEEAIVQYNHYKEIAPNDPRGDIGVESCTIAPQWKDNPTRYALDKDTLKELNAYKEINSSEDDFAPIIADEKGKSIVFTSSRENSTGARIDDWTGQNFSDLYITYMSQKGDWSTPVFLDDQNVINTEGNEGTATFANKYNTMYFTRCGYEKKKVLGCQIFKTEKKGKVWGEPEPVKLGVDSTKIYGHPSVSKDELTLYFVSDMDGGQGGRDIWVAKRTKRNKSFETPRNLGPTINTPGDEMFPFLRSDSILYYSSNYLPGMGGLDIFRTVKTGDKWSKPENLKYPINSSADDFGICFFPNSEEEKGYLSSNRRAKGVKGGDDIYSFIRVPLLFTLSGVVKDDRTLQPLAGANIKMIGSNSTSIELKTDNKGYYKFDETQILPETSYELTVTKEGYFSDKGRETTVGLQNNKNFILDFVLVPIPVKPIILPEILYDLAKWDLKPQYQDSLQGLITILEANPTLTIELGSHTDTRASDTYNDTLSQKRAQSVVDYLVSRGIDQDRLLAKGYGEKVNRVINKEIVREGFTFPEGTLLNDEYINKLPSKNIQEAAHQLNRRTEFRVLSMNFVPKPKIDTLNKGKANAIQIVTNPNENSFTITPGEKETFTAGIYLNDFADVFTYEKAVVNFSMSPDKAFYMLEKGFISKTDFLGDATKVLLEGKVVDKAKFVLKKVRIGTNDLQNVEVTVVKDLKSPIVLGDAFLKTIGNYTIDKEKNKLIFQ
ncbi:MAG: OmpA family protein [Bacteroidetes bacterium]|nr:OmpA family protein [Bacteroidota bacterium]